MDKSGFLEDEKLWYIGDTKGFRNAKKNVLQLPVINYREFELQFLNQVKNWNSC
jgi:hypothetical protein